MAGVDKKTQVERCYCEWGTNLLSFVQDCLSHHCTSPIPKFHKEIYSFCDVGNNMCLAAPRGFAKSSVVSVFYPIREALWGRRTNIHIISASEGLAVSWLRKIKSEIENNKSIYWIFGDQSSEKWTEDHIILRNGCEIRARGAGGQSRGPRPDLVILDDIETEDSVASEEQRDKLRNWINKAVIPSLAHKGRIVWIGTFISPLCLLKEKIDNIVDDKWIRKIYSAYRDGIERPENAIWQELWDHKSLQQRKLEIGSFAFSSEYLNNPLFNEHSAIKEHQIRYWEQLPDDLTIVCAMDPAYSDDERADDKVCVAWGCDTRGNRYLLEYINTKAPIGEYIDMSLNMYLRYKGRVIALGVPNSGTERSFFTMVSKRINEKHLPILPTPVANSFTTSGGSNIRNKHKRIVAALQPLFEQGRCFIHKDHEEAKSQLLNIGASKHDDIVDAMTYAESLMDTDMKPIVEENVDHFGEPIEDMSMSTNYGYD